MSSEEDDRRELERLERDLAAIEARWSSDGYQQRTSSQVLDDERATRRELQMQMMKVEARLRSSSATPALGTGSVRANVGMSWEPLALFEIPERPRDEAALPPAEFGVATSDKPLRLEDLENELFDLFAQKWGTQGWYTLHPALVSLRRTWVDVPGARRLLGLAFRSVKSWYAAEALHPEKRDHLVLEPPTLRRPLLTDAAELPDELSGLTKTQAMLLRVFRECAPDTAAFTPVATILGEVRETVPEFDEARFIRECVLMGHPSIRRLPLLSFQGFTGRLDPQPSFTHARLSRIGREVADEKFPLPLLLANGAAGNGTCLLPYHPLELARACERIANGQDGVAHVAAVIRGFELADGAAVSDFQALRIDAMGVHVLTSASVQFHLVVSQRRARLLIHKFPFPLAVADIRADIQRAVEMGCLEGIKSVVDESSAEEQRLSLEFDHVVCLVPAHDYLMRSRVLSARYDVAISVEGTERPTVMDVLRHFVASRKERAESKLREIVTRAEQRAQECEAVCVALEAIERVLAVLRDTISDEEGIAALAAMGEVDREALRRLPFEPSHRYERGFNDVQARFLVKQRKLAQRSRESARIDWARALEEVEVARRSLTDEGAVMDVVRTEFLDAIARFSDEPRRSRPF